jgi:chaperone modulatory protein CbpM
MTEPTSILEPAEIISRDAVCTLEQICLACHVDADWVAGLVEHGVIEPAGAAMSDWQFTSLAIVRVARAKRLERDLSLNTPGIALVLELLDEIEALRSRLKASPGGTETP